MSLRRVAMRFRACALIAAAALACAQGALAAPVAVTDDIGQQVRLRSPAQRIVSLAPHATELLFAAGAGELVVGTVAYSDFPEAAKKIPRVGDSSLLDLERIVQLKPDLLVVWFHGNSEQHLARLRALGIPMFYSEPKTLADIASSLTRLGQLAGTQAAAARASASYARELGDLRERYASRSPVTLFFQVWKSPLLTINGEQIISDAIRACGGRNIFEHAAALVPTVDVEAVASANPEAIVTTGTGGNDDDAFDVWRKLPSLRATSGGNLLLVRTETLGRAAPRVLEGVAALCRALDGVRQRRRP